MIKFEKASFAKEVCRNNYFRKAWYIVMKKRLLSLSAILCMFLLCGCTTAEAPKDENLNVNDGQPSAAHSEETTPAEPVELSDDEIQFFTDFIRQDDNYGFLLSEYDAPKDVNLEEVLYNGAGFGVAIPEEELPSYLAAIRQDDIYLDCIKLPKKDIQELLQNKLGIGLEDITMVLNWTYLPEYESYYHEAGDTNYVPFSCLGGSKSGDTYTLRFTSDPDWSTIVESCETVLIKSGNGYQFLSNHLSN